MRYGSLFAGYGGLELGVQSVLGGTTAWHCEIEPAPSRILAHHWPDVPNLGDITQVRWADVEPVDVLAGGFPCQDVSHAGKRLGLKPGTRSGLWSHMAYAIDQLRPQLVVAENVRGLLSAEAGGDLEPCPWCVGDGERGALRALGAVLGDLADLGYDAQWVGLRAADAGAPHGRFRVFVFAWPAEHADCGGCRPLRLPGVGGSLGSRRDDPRDAAATQDTSADVSADADGVGHERCRSARGRWTRPADCREPAAHTPRHGRDERWPEPARLLRRPDAAQRSDSPAPDARSERHGRGQDGRALGRLDGEDAGRARERERAREVAGDRSRAAVAWGDYQPAIRRWERLTRPAPAPTEASAKGSQRLSPRFVEWLMGLPAGHVTDPAISLTRNEQLKALGNGVVPQQAALATRLFLNTAMERAA